MTRPAPDPSRPNTPRPDTPRSSASRPGDPGAAPPAAASTVPDPFDRCALARNRARAERIARDGADFLVRLAVDDLVERLDGVERRFERATLLDPPHPYAAERVAASTRVAALETVRTEPGGRVPLEPESVDLAVSAMALHVAADIPGALAQIARALKPDGLFLAVLPGGDTLRELREAWLAAESETAGGAGPRVHPTVDVRDAGALLQRAGFALPVADVDRLTVRYDSMLSLAAELRAMGMGNALADRSRRPTRRDTLMRAAVLYDERFGDPDGRVRATFDLVSLSGWRPHSSQQKPLAPGSGAVSLADVLGGSGE